MRALTAILSIMLLLAGCGAIPSAKHSENVFQINIGSDPPTLHPGLATEHTSTTVIKSLFEGLTRIGQDGKPKLAAAHDVKISEDRLTYTFILRDLKWNNGAPVTAADFEFAWKWALDPKNNAKYAYLFYPILNAEKAHKGELPLEQIGIEAIDEKTLVVKLQNPTPYFLQLAGNAPYLPIPSQIAKSEPNWHLETENFISNGPFRLADWERGTSLILEKNEDYWDAEQVALDRLEMIMLNDARDEWSLFEKGDLDWIGAPFSTLSDEATEKLNVEGNSLKTTPIAAVYEFRFNTERSPFQHPKIRKALAYAIDRQTIVESVAPGRQLPATAHVPPTIFPENKKGLFTDFDLKAAKRLLTEGMREAELNELPKIELPYQPNEAHAKVARAVQEMWEKHLGLEVILKDMSWEEQLAETLNGEFQLARVSWVADFNDAVNFLEIFTVPKGNNMTSWTNDEYNQLIASSYKETDHERRITLLKEAENILADEMPSIPIYFYTFTYASAERIKGVYIDPLGNLDFRWATIQP